MLSVRIGRFLIADAIVASILLLLLVWKGATKPKQGDELTNSIGMKLVYIPAGTFTMGSPKEEQDAVIADFEKSNSNQPDAEFNAWRRAEGPEHQVEISKGFYLGIYEVT